MALGRVAVPDVEPLRRSMRRGLEWFLSMQNADGGGARSTTKTIYSS